MKKILLDTSPYLHLARVLHPLIGKKVFEGSEIIILHECFEGEVHPEKKNQLSNKFQWASAKKYKDNRTHSPIIPPEKENDIKLTEDFVSKMDLGSELSYADKLCIVHAEVLGMRLVSDDDALLKTAKEFDIDAFTTVELLMRLRQSKDVTRKQIQELANQFMADQNYPPRFNDSLMKLLEK